MKKENWLVIIAGVLVGVAALVLTKLGNPANMGFCIACFERDIAGAVGMHSAAKVQYVRPEIIGLVLGAFIMALAGKEFRPQAGSSPATRFVLGAFVMIGALVFLGCPLRMVLRMGGGDLNALVGLAGFVIGIVIGILFLKRGFSLKRSYPAKLVEGTTLPAVMFVLLVLVLAVPAIFHASEAGPGSMHAPAIVALLIALVVGALAQKSRLCMVGGIRDSILVKDNHLLYGFIAIFLTVLIGNLVQGSFKLGFDLQPIAHSSHLWNLLGMVLVGWGSVLLGGCPLRQLILAGSGNGDSAVTVFGMIVGAAFAHNFALAGNPDSTNDAGELVVGGKDGLQPIEKTVIDRCVRLIYRDMALGLGDGKPPLLQDLYEELLKQPEPEARRVATALELYCTGSLNLFNHPTNVKTDSRVVCIVLKNMGENLRKIAMHITNEFVSQAVDTNFREGVATWCYFDEFHVLLRDPLTASYFVAVWKMLRKKGCVPSALTQNVKDLLASREIENILDNTDFMILLSQAQSDRTILAKQLGISEHQLSYITHSNSGEGLLFYGNVTIPFVDRFPKGEIYNLLTTRPEDVKNEAKTE